MLPNFLLPHNAIDATNPVFKKELRRVRWFATEPKLNRYNKYVLLGLPLLIIFWWLLERLNLNLGYVRPDFKYNLINFLIILAIGVMLLSSLYSVPTVIGPLNARFTSPYWDSLRLTSQDDRTILMSQDAIAQLHLWLFTAIEVGLRSSIVILFTLNNFYDLYHAYADKTLYLQSLLSLWCVIGWGVILLTGIGFILEPIIRIRLIIALQILITFHIRTLIFALLTGLISIITIHLAEILIFGGLWSFFQSLAEEENGGLAVLFCFVPLTIVIILIAWIFALGFRRVILSLAYKAAFRQD